MKKVFLIALALGILTRIAVAKSDMSMGKDMKKDTSTSAPLKEIKDTVKADGGKTWFVADKDEKSWGGGESRRAEGT